MLPSVAIAGGGPAGLLVALLLSRQGLSIDVFEEDTPTRSLDWNPRSYTISLNSRGQAALDAAGVLSRVQLAALPRRAVVVHKHDSQHTVPKVSEFLGLTRETLCAVLQQTLLEEGKVILAEGRGERGYECHGHTRSNTILRRLASTKARASLASNSHRRVTS